MEIMHRAPYVDIICFNESKSGENVVYDVMVGCWRNQCSEPGNDDYHTLLGDLLLLVDGKPESVSDLKRVGRTWALTLVKSNEDDSTSISVKASQPIKFQDGMLACFVMNVTSPKRIWNLLHMHRNLNIIKEIFYADSMGPPRMGKTMTVSVLLFILMEMKHMTLSCAPMNVAIVQLASCVQSLVRESFKTTTASGNYLCSVGDLLLFGNKERLKVSADIKEIYLEHRVKRLVEYLGLVTGWKHYLRSMIDLLEICVSKYYIFIENKSLKEKQLKHENEGKRTMLEIKSFIKFVQERFSSSVAPLKRDSLIFSTTLSSYKLHAVNMDPLNMMVLEEAGQLKEAEFTIPLQLLGVKHAILIGDEHQLHVIVESNVSLCLSFYLKTITINSNLTDSVLVDREEKHDDGRSRRNMVEVAVVIVIVKNLFTAWKDSKKKFTIGVISPYAPQVVLIQEKLAHKYEKLDGFSVKVKSIDRFQGGEEDIILSIVRSNSHGNLEAPKSWSASQKMIRLHYLSDNEDKYEVSMNPGAVRNHIKNSKVSESLLLMKFYSLSCGFVNHLLLGKEVNLPMQVTDEQMDIILFCKNSFIIGRSETGKTTILIMKLLEQEQNFRIVSDGIYQAKSSHIKDAEVDDDPKISKPSVLHQLVVTVSPNLCYVVKQIVSHLTSISSNGSSSAEINLDNTCVISSELNDIPDTFINMPMKYYPLVRFIRLRQVTFDRYSSLYWPHFNANLAKKLDPDRVFTEIISHIKGGMRAGECSDGKLSFEGYLFRESSLVSGEAPVLLESCNDENAIVTIFGSSRSGGEIMGFVAEQVILVRDDCARNEIFQYVGKKALVLTILECPEPITPFNEGTSNQNSKSIIEGHVSALKELLKEPSNQNLIKPILLDFDDIQHVSDDEVKGIVKGKTKVDEEDLSKPFKEILKCPFTRRIVEFSSPSHRMLENVKIYDGTGDSKDHMGRFVGIGNQREWPMPEKFLNRFGMLMACGKDPTEILKIAQSANETLPHFKERWVSESNVIPNVPELMQISSFMSSHKCLELAKRFSDSIPKTLDEMLKRVDDYLRSKEAFRITELPRGSSNEETHWYNGYNEMTEANGFLMGIAVEILATEHQLHLPQPAPLIGVPNKENLNSARPLERSLGSRGQSRGISGLKDTHRRRASVEIMFEHCFNMLHPSIRSRLVETQTTVSGFSRNQVKPLGKIELDLCFVESGRCRRAIMKFTVIPAPLPNNIILGRPSLKQLRAVPSTIHRMMKFPTP
nr:UvrD-like helicase, ATP-binding domain, P-loop containing nucleoside triphosphate hydrolase [Tanacetum cinerariifolium]